MPYLQIAGEFWASLLLHLIIFLIIIFSIDFDVPRPVIENMDKKDIISVVILGDIPNSKIMPERLSTHEPMNPKSFIPPPVKKVLPAPLKSRVIALKQEKKKQIKVKNPSNLFAKDLLADIKKQVAKRQKIKQTQLKTQFQKTLQEQAENSMRQSLLAENFRIKATEAKKTQGQINKYQALIIQAISENWIVPLGAKKSLSCELMIRVAANGAVLDVRVTKSSGDIALDRSARAAVLKASPLPVPSDPAALAVFRQFVLKVKPENILAADSNLGPG